MKRTCRLLIGVTACLVASVATASDGKGNYAIWGAGSRSCHQFTRAAADATQLPTYVPNWAEFLALSNRRILADQMDFLKSQFNRQTRIVGIRRERIEGR